MADVAIFCSDLLSGRRLMSVCDQFKQALGAKVNHVRRILSQCREGKLNVAAREVPGVDGNLRGDDSRNMWPMVTGSESGSRQPEATGSDFPEHSSAQFTLSGEYVLGGLFPIHLTPLDDVDRLKPVVPKCEKSKFRTKTFTAFQAMRFAVEDINNSTDLLPSITLGYDIADSCFEVVDIQAIFRFLSGKQGAELKILSNYTVYQPKVIAVIGPPSTDVAITIARLLGFFLVPQISYQASGEILSDKMRFPSFFRTIPSDKNQAKAMALLIQEFNWNWIAVIRSDNEYGRKGVNKVVELTSAAGICIAYQAIISTSPELVIQMINNISNTVNVTVLFSNEIMAQVFFSLVVAQNLTSKVWIINEAISLSQGLTSIPNIESIGMVMGTAIKEGQMAHFEEFLDKPLSLTNPRMLPDSELEKRLSYNVYLAVYAVAHALHNLLQCNVAQCEKNQSILPWQLLSSLKEVKFNLHDDIFYFDEYGDPPSGYDIVLWDWMRAQVRFKTIGSYLPNDGQIKIDSSLIHWNWENNLSQRSQKTGEYPNIIPLFKKGNRDNPGNYNPGAPYIDPYHCTDCRWQQWSPPKSHRCLERDLHYLEWNSIFSIFLLILANGGIVLTITIAIIFTLNCNTPVVKSAGGRICFLKLMSMLCGFSCVYFYIGKPNNFCKIRLPFFMVRFTLCLSCILVRSFQIICIFKMATKLPKAHDYWVKYNGQYLFFFLSTFVQIVICSVWLNTDPPTPKGHIIEKAIIMDCGNGSMTTFLLSLFYTVFLSVACFFFAYMGRDLPKNYNEAKSIAFSMMICFVYYILYMMSMVTPNQERYTSSIQTFLIVTSAFSIAMGYFLTKCYIILFMPQKNSTAYFQSCIQDYTKRLNGAN
ncbi:taste receptor type 1 member 1-like [Rhincodon typus]|uniref:taste receptor type 1 member 1-like n=1 Tax=Rhincodon typus TaxID=259920 RepID=UPI0009A45D7E|nr:taste receptor type 1 member 1-like [Rhincodon typus]